MGGPLAGGLTSFKAIGTFFSQLADNLQSIKDNRSLAGVYNPLGSRELQARAGAGRVRACEGGSLQ